MVGDRRTAARRMAPAISESGRTCAVSTEAATAGFSAAANGELMVLPIREAREHFERAYLQAQLERFSGNISRTASFVGMERSALHRKLKSLNIHTDD